eukprot:CAMPEP_0179215236 /NCGR_PEP_ID=MMETSP0797-20121207/2747_1 /TAXON_ID=47934 /ORGANISM="Dinophysis acuminata, Strain DAEP01" /LENGTH=213 /DNA_ID=CAMNT_0020921333 /DNA_START=9 /DNA_END=649 /DNA_ORIENTATION=-
MASPAPPPRAPAPNEAAARSSFDCEDPRVLVQQRAGEGGMLKRKHLLFAVVFGVYVGVVVYFATEPQQSNEHAAGNRAPLKHAAFATSRVLPTPRRVLFTPAAAVREARMSMAGPGTRRLYHATNVDAAESILKENRFRPGNDGYDGAGVYFASTAEGAKRKSRSGGDVVFVVEVPDYACEKVCKGNWVVRKRNVDTIVITDVEYPSWQEEQN